MNESFDTIPNQAFTLHLTGIVPADKEDDWDPTITQWLTKELNKWTSKEPDAIYEANVVFALRNTLVANIMRLYNLSTTVVHCSLKSYLQRKNFGIMSPESCDKVIAMAKSAGKVKCAMRPMLNLNLLTNLFIEWFKGVKVIDAKKAKTKKSVESVAAGSSTTSPAGSKSQALNETEPMASNANIRSTPSVSGDSNESTFEEESNEKWANPWKVQHKGVEITTYYSPDNFYVAHKSELYVFDSEVLCKMC